MGESYIGREKKKRSSFRDVGNLPHNDVAPFSLGEKRFDLGGISWVFLCLIIFSVPCRENVDSEWSGDFCCFQTDDPLLLVPLVAIGSRLYDNKVCYLLLPCFNTAQKQLPLFLLKSPEREPQYSGLDCIL